MNLRLIRNPSKLLKRLVLTIGIPIILVIIAVEIIDYQAYRSNYLEHIDLKQKELNDQIKTYFSLQKRGLDFIEEIIEPRLKALSAKIVNVLDSAQTNQRLDLDNLRKKLHMDPMMEDIYIINTNGIVINTTFQTDLLMNLANNRAKYFSFLEDLRLSKQYTSEKFTLEFSTQKIRKFTYQATSDGQFIVQIGLYSKKASELVSSFAEKIKEITKMYPYLLEANLYIPADKPFSFYKRITYSKQREDAINKVFEKKEPLKINIKTDNLHLRAHYFYSDDNNSILYPGNVVEIIVDQTVIDHNLFMQALYRFFYIFIITSVILLIIFNRLFKDVSSPLDKVNRTLAVLSKGDLENADKFNFHKDDELEGIGNNLNNFVSQLKNTAKFAKNIGIGNWNEEFELASSKDVIGVSLLDMRNNLRQIEEEKLIREKLDADTLWNTNGLNKFAEVLRQDANNIELFCNNVISNIVKYIDVNQGALFLFNDSDKSEEKYLEQIASYAYGQSRKIKKQIKCDEGLLGAAVSTKHTIYRTEIPKDYISITSGLGDALPKSLLIVPLKLNDEVLGAIELASFYEINPVRIHFVEEIAESISYTLSITKSTIRTNKLASEWKLQSVVFGEKEQGLNVEILNLKSENENLNFKIRSLEDEKDTLHQNLESTLMQIKQLKERVKKV